MKITQKQLMVLIYTLKDSLKFQNAASSAFSFTYEIRRDAMKEIYNQQADNLIEIE